MTGIVVAAFECGIEYQNGRGSIRDTALNVIKGFLAASLFTTVPVELYKLSISLQGSFTAGITGLGRRYWDSCGRDCAVSSGCCYLARSCYIWSFWWNRKYQQPDFYDLSLDPHGLCGNQSVLCELKTGGILLIQIAVGSLYLFSVPRDILMDLLAGASR